MQELPTTADEDRPASRGRLGRWLQEPLLHFLIAGAVLFLCGPDAGYITGQILAVDGGFTAAGMDSRPAR